MGDALRRQGHTHGGAIGQGAGEQQGVAGAGGGPLGQTLELDAAAGALQFGEAKVGAEALVEPAKAGGVFAAEDRLMGFGVVFEGPHRIPEIMAIGGHHAAFTGGGEDLVLAEATGGHITDTGQGLAVSAGAIDLSAVFDHGDAMCTSQPKNQGILAGQPTQRRSAPRDRQIQERKI